MGFLDTVFAGIGGGATGLSRVLEEQSKSDDEKKYRLATLAIAQAKAKQEVAHQTSEDQRHIADDAIKGIMPGTAPDSRAPAIQAMKSALSFQGIVPGMAEQMAPSVINTAQSASPDAFQRYRQLTPNQYLDRENTPEAVTGRHTMAVESMRAGTQSRQFAQQQEQQGRLFAQQEKMQGQRESAAEERTRLHLEALRDKGARGVVHESDAGTVLIDPMTGQARPVTGQNGQQLQKPVPPQMVTAYMNNRSQISKIDDAIAKLSAHPNAVGFFKGRIDAYDQMTDRGGTDARASIADVGSMLMHDRSGAAVTASEYPRLAPFVPSAHDRPDVAKIKLQRLKAAASLMNSEIAESYPGLSARSAPSITAPGNFSPENPYPRKP